MKANRIITHAALLLVGLMVTATGASAQAWTTTTTAGDLVTDGSTSRVGILTSTPNEALDVNGNIVASGGITAGGQVNINAGLTVTGAGNFQGGSFTDLSIANDLNVNHDTYANNDLFVHGNTSLNGTLHVNGTSIFSNDVSMSQNLFVNLDVTASNYFTWSDARLKENITPMTNVLAKLENIQPVYYNYNNVLPRPAGRQLGFIAQEVQKQFPEAVTTASNGYLAVGYGNMAAVAIEAVKEQQKTIQQLRAANADLEARLARMEAALQKLTGCCPEPATTPNLK